MISNLEQPSTEKNTIQDFNSPHYKKREFTSHLISDASLSFFTRTMNRLKPRCLQTQLQVSKFSFITFLHLHFFHTLFQLISKLSHDTNFHISHLNLHLIKTLLFQVFLVHAKFCQFSFKYFKFTLTFIISLLTFYFYLYTYRLIFILSRFSLRSKLLSKISYHKKLEKVSVLSVH